MPFKQKYTDEQVAEWQEMYKSGLSTLSIAKKTGASEVTVWRRLSKIMTMRTNSEGQLLRPVTGNMHSGGYRRRGQKLAHRIVAETVLGRALSQTEQVHHVDDNKTNNSPSNLWVFPNAAAHTKYHMTQTIHPDTIKLEELNNETS